MPDELKPVSSVTPIEGAVTLPADTSATPAIYTNHINLVATQEGVMLEFRHVVPDFNGISAQPGVPYAVDADLKKIPPHVRVIMPEHIAASLTSMLKRTFENDTKA